jgi:hypothetical protein
MSSTYDPHELKIIRRGVSIDKVIAAYKHFGSYRKAAEVCGIAKGTVKAVVERYHVVALPASLPRKASYHPKRHYSDFAKWHKAHMNDKNLPHSLAEFASLANSNVNIVKCYFYRCRKETGLQQKRPKIFPRAFWMRRRNKRGKYRWRAKRCN